MATEQQTVFLVHAPIRDLGDYRKLAEQACKLKPYGKVDVNISTLAAKSFFQIPEGGSPWHQYASNNPCPYKFFPHETLKPFIPADFVETNRKLMLAKAEILKELGLGAAFWSYEPNFLPEAFYEAYPHLRGPRVDHPRRSRQEAFAPCLARPEVQEMIAWMVGQIVKHVPHLRTYFFKTNDAGPGICWSDWQYTGPNGPAACRQRTMGQRVRDLLDAINRGAAAGGGRIERIHMTGNFSAAEVNDIERNLPDNAFMRRGRADRARQAAIRGMIDPCFPCRGIFNPMGILQDLQTLADGQARTVFVSFRPSYDRGYEDLQTTAKVFDMAADYLAKPVTGIIPALQKLQEYCRQWAGAEEAGEKLFETMVRLQEVFKYKEAALGGLKAMNWGVSLRHVTRPLVIVPSNLTAEEESYWLPHVFNISQEEARQDYVDLHGGRARPINGYAARGVFSRFRRLADELEGFADAPEGQLLGKTAKSLRIYCCFLQSSVNFYEAQVIRDRNKEKLSEIQPRPPKTSSWTGDPDLIRFNEIMRDELDNAQELIDLLEDGGMELTCHAEDTAEEDTFLLGPGLIDQVKAKRLIMRRHWLDIQNHLATPLK